MSGIQMIMAAGGGGEAYYIGRWTTLGFSSYSANGQSIFVKGSYTDGFFVGKCSANGASTIWGRYFTRSGYSDQTSYMAISENEQYMVMGGRSYSGGATSPHAFLINAVDGTLIWARTFSGYPASQNSTEMRAIGVDNSGNVYINVYSNGPKLSKISLAGSIQWTRSLSPSSGSHIAYPCGIDADNSGTGYIYAGFSLVNGGVQLIAKLAMSDGSVANTWQFSSNPSESNNPGNKLLVRDGQVYLNAPRYGYSNWAATQITKISTSGTFGFSNYLWYPNNDAGYSRVVMAYGLHISALDGGVYLTGQSQISGSQYAGFYFKYSSSGGGLVAGAISTTGANNSSNFSGVYGTATKILISPGAASFNDFHSFPADGSKKQTFSNVFGYSTVTYSDTGVPNNNQAATSMSSYSWSSTGTYSISASNFGDYSNGAYTVSAADPSNRIAL